MMYKSFAPKSGGLPGMYEKDWRKFVLINPINVTFKENKDDGKGTS